MESTPHANKTLGNIVIINCIVNAPLMLTSILGNSLVFIAIWRTVSPRSPSMMFICSLAVSDLLVGLIVQPLYIANLLISAQDSVVHDGLCCLRCFPRNHGRYKLWSVFSSSLSHAIRGNNDVIQCNNCNNCYMTDHVSFILRDILESFNLCGYHSHPNQRLSYNFSLFLHQNFPDCPPTPSTDSPSRMHLARGPESAWVKSEALE